MYVYGMCVCVYVCAYITGEYLHHMVCVYVNGMCVCVYVCMCVRISQERPCSICAPGMRNSLQMAAGSGLSTLR